MILGVDHLALSCDDLYDASEAMKELGFEIKFIQENMPNHPSKISFLRSYHKFHSLAYCWNRNFVSIELIKHQSQLNNFISHYQILLSCSVPKLAPILDEPLLSSIRSFLTVWQHNFDDILPRPSRWELFKTSMWYDERGCNSSSAFVKSVLLPVSDFEGSKNFWTEGLGFQVIKNGTIRDKKFFSLHFKAIVPRWSLDLILTENDEIKNVPYLDDAGFTCVAFLTNNIEGDCKFLMQYNTKNKGEIFDLEVGGKELKIVVLRGPSHELIELIELVK